MGGEGIADHLSVALATARATPRQKRIALWLGVLSLAAFAAFVPFTRLALVKAPAFIPAYQTALFFIDCITAVVLVDQFLRLRSVGILVLAAGYLFDALMVAVHTLSFPGVFSPTGLLGAKEQTTAWLYVFWHGGFPLFVIAYGRLRRREASQPARSAERAMRMVGIATTAVALLVILLTLLATRGHDWLPVLIRGGQYPFLVSKGVSIAICLVTSAALYVLWQREMRVMDLWLMLVTWTWLLDIGLSSVLSFTRFDLGFYVGRAFGLLSASFLLAALLVEMASMYAVALRAISRAESKVAAPTPKSGQPEVPPQPARPFASTEAFIRDKNIAHYRRLLRSGMLSDSEQRTIGELLREEEARARSV